MEKGVVVGVDVGSSDARAVAIDGDGSIVATAKAAYGDAYDPASGVADPKDWIIGLADVLAELGIEKPAALGIGGYSPTTVASTGELALTFRHPAGRSSSPPDQHAAHWEALQEQLGPRVQPRLLWDYLLSLLGGDPGVQSVWAGMAPLPEFGEPVAVGTPVGTSNGSYGIPAGVTLVPGANDAYMTVWAGGVGVPGLAFDPGGRAGGLGIAVATDDHEDLARYGMPTHVPGVFIVGGPVASHGALLDWWSNITGRTLDELIPLAATVEPGAGGLMVLPYLEGERAPRWNRDLRGLIDGLTMDSDVAAITRALLESTAYGLGHIASSLAAQGVVLDRVVSSGGPSRSELWTSIKSAVLEVPIDVPECAEMAAYGGALAAGAGMGWWPRPSEGAHGDWPTPRVTTIQSTPRQIYREGLERFIALGDEAVNRMTKVNATN